MGWMVSFNCGRKESATFRRRVIKSLRGRFSKQQPLMNGQEIDEADSGDEHAWLKQIMPRYKWCNFQTHVPIGVGVVGWMVLMQDLIDGHPGIEKLTPRRWISKVKVRTRWNKHKRFVMYNNHTTRLGAHGGKLELRKQYHREYIVNLSEDVHVEVDENGESCAIVGDFNMSGIPKIHPRQRVIMDNGLDKIIVVEPEKPRPGKPKVHFVVKEKRVIPMNIDGHNALAVRFGLKVIK